MRRFKKYPFGSHGGAYFALAHGAFLTSHAAKFKSAPSGKLHELNNFSLRLPMRLDVALGRRQVRVSG